MEYACCYDSPLGRMIMTSDGRALTGLRFEEPGQVLPSAVGGCSLPVFDDTRRWLDDFFAGRDPGPAPSLELTGTPFRLKVWALLREIPRGQTVSYSYIASRVAEVTGRRTSPRAVGQAAGRNPIAVIIPCHRVVGADGSLTGYAAGADRKARLLALERAWPAP
ncbi:MAG: methylated-DNA--[protein]-cysteine S-methyltransferase [Abditibacteriota bacterium]|nr:methylated-DNA--[protein]-cysteine S-methyltransferase [Abditibacteriota bacterium]